MRLSEVKDNEFPLIDQGIHDCEIASVEKKPGEKAPYFGWRYEILRGIFRGRLLFDNTSISNQSLWRLKKLLMVLIKDEQELNSIMELDVDSSYFENALKRLKGRKCRVYIEHAPSTKDPEKMVEDVKEVFEYSRDTDLSGMAEDMVKEEGGESIPF